MKVAKAITLGMQDNIRNDVRLGGPIFNYWLELIKKRIFALAS